MELIHVVITTVFPITDTCAFVRNTDLTFPLVDEIHLLADVVGVDDDVTRAEI